MSEKPTLDEKFAFDPDAISGGAQAATDFLKAMSHEGRLMILCHLAKHECSVMELEKMLSMRQAAVSQQLARLRLDRIVGTRREGKSVYYYLLDERVKQFIPILYDIFCNDDG